MELYALPLEPGDWTCAIHTHWNLQWSDNWWHNIIRVTVQQTARLAALFQRANHHCWVDIYIGPQIRAMNFIS